MNKSPGAIYRDSPEGVRRRDASNNEARARHPSQINTGNADSRPKRALAPKNGDGSHRVIKCKRVPRIAPATDAKRRTMRMIDT
jgi:hypothetical protein